MSNEHNNGPAVPDGLQWFTVAEHGIPEIGAEVIGGLWYTDPWIKTEFATTFMWGQCRVVESKHRDFKDGKQWCTFGPSHNQITHWARINTPGQTSAPAPAVPQGWKLVMVEDGAPANEPDWDEVKRQAEVSTGIPINQPTYSVIIREIRRWLIQRDTAVPSKPAIPMSESQRADMICAVAAICTGTSSRTVAATAIEWVERHYGITTPAALREKDGK